MSTFVQARLFVGTGADSRYGKGFRRGVGGWKSPLGLKNKDLVRSTGSERWGQIRPLKLQSFAKYTTTRCCRRRQTSPPVPSPGELDETYASSLILANLPHSVKNMTSSTKPEVHTYCIVVRGGPSHGHR